MTTMANLIILKVRKDEANKASEEGGRGSTPRSVVNHARQLKRIVDNCATRKRAADVDREEE